MSGPSVITDVSETLRTILDVHLNPPNPGGANQPTGVGAPVTITVDSPQRSAGEDLRVNLYLYHILQDETRRNTGRVVTQRTSSSARIVDEPLPLKLYYMVTAFAPEGRTEHRLIGEAIQALYLNRIVPVSALQGSLAPPPDPAESIQAAAIQLVLLNQDLETLHRIWGNFQEALRPSATYEVEGIYLDAQPNISGTDVKTVLTRGFDIVPIPFLSDVTPAAARPGDTIRIYGANLDLPPPAPAAATSLVNILFNGVPVAPLADRRTGRALSIVIPASTRPGVATIQAQIGEFASRSIQLEVLPP